ncbi:hypothetical protein GWI33_014606 [Rhynchophorus ferrugineus]|uniref:Uncharacterized protein n=1 Tax=Rhynchophorus ferrugineus TaxID=354439 RepID=A0A834MC67_RHYFE|nr:hypothetical protein GWI33_014606 [Rhynchophorus ferrugineus]
MASRGFTIDAVEFRGSDLSRIPYIFLGDRTNCLLPYLTGLANGPVKGNLLILWPPSAAARPAELGYVYRRN